MAITPKFISQVLGLPLPEDADRQLSRIIIDSRSLTLPAETLFIALRSRNNDGHRFINHLLKLGVRNFIVEKIPDEIYNNGGANFFVVDNTLEAMRTLAAAKREDSKSIVVALTGSAGKTITKELLYNKLNRQYKIVRSPRSYNSQIGVPLTLLEIEKDTEIALVEVGISLPGEMERQESIVRPDIVVFTPMNDEHDRNFTSHKEKIFEKTLLAKNAKKIVSLGSENDVLELLRETDADIEIVADTDFTFVQRCEALAQRTSTLLCAQESAECEKPYIVRTRLNVIEGMNNCKIILDSFTPDIVSLRGALDFMKRQGGDFTRTLILDTDNAIDDVKLYRDLIDEYVINKIITIGKRRLSENIDPSTDYISFDDINDFMAKMSANDFSDEIILMRGAVENGFDSIYSMLEAKQHETVMEVNLDAIIANFNFFRSKIDSTTGIICMLKAGGYGNGSVELARTLQSQGAAYLAVAVVDEGVELRRAGITMPIIVLNPRAQNHRMMIEYRLEPAIYSFNMLNQVIENAARYGVKNYPIHIKLETGMRRLGFVENELSLLGERLAQCREIKVNTVFSHLACADDPTEDEYTFRQYTLFDRCCDNLENRLGYKPKRHILNSTGIIRFPKQQKDFVRLGIGLYGIPTLFDGSESELQNVASLSSVIISIKRWPAGESVGYNRLGKLDRDTTVATIPIGYADGLNRHLGCGNASFYVNGSLCPTVGNICMDICMIDVTDVDCQVGDRVEIFGENVTAIDLANRLDTIPYEILTSISPRVKRVYFRE